MEALVLRNDQVVLEDSLDEVLSMQKIFELLEVNRILGRLAFKSIDQSLKLVMSVDTTFLDMIKQLVLEKIPSVL
jgi:hypothetical protein